MKQKLSGFISLSLALALLCGCSSSTQNTTGKTETDASSQEESQAQMQPEESDTQTADAAALVADIPTTQYFTDDAVADEDLEQILLAGVNAPSAMNGQPWHFSVVTDNAVLQDIADEMSAAMTTAATAPVDTAETEDTDSPESTERADAEGVAEQADTTEQIEEDAEAPDEGSPDAVEETSAEPAEDTTEAEAETSDTAAEETAESEEPSAMPAASTTVKAGLTDAPVAIIISCADGSELDAGLACQNMSVEAQLLGYGTKILFSPTIALNGSRQAEFYEQLGVPAGYTVVAVLLIGVEDTSVDQAADTYTGATERNPLDEVVTYIKPE